MLFITTYSDVLVQQGQTSEANISLNLDTQEAQIDNTMDTDNNKIENVPEDPNEMEGEPIPDKEPTQQSQERASATDDHRLLASWNKNVNQETINVTNVDTQSSIGAIDSQHKQSRNVISQPIPKKNLKQKNFNI